MAFTQMQKSSVAPLIYSFPAVSNNAAKVLILGSIPGKASLDVGQYYAHPRNLFWPIMGQLSGAIPDLPYENRLMMLQKSGIALWDVLQSCSRTSSLDIDIKDETPNDINGFLQRHTKIKTICFNGDKARESFDRHFPEIKQSRLYRLVKLPSTSPAHASMTYEQKLESWKTILY